MFSTASSTSSPPQPSYLSLAIAGIFDDAESAVAAWRDQVGDSAPGVEPVTSEVLAAEWLGVMLPGTEHAVSPRRVAVTLAERHPKDAD